MRKSLIPLLAAPLLLLSCQKTPEDKMIAELRKKTERYQNDDIEDIKIEVLSIDTLNAGGLFYDAKIKMTVKHKAFDTPKSDTTMVMFSDEYIIID